MDRAREPGGGTPVVAIGHPQGLLRAATRGIVSARRGDLVVTDALVDHGSSGGPLLDEDGRVVGIVSQRVAGELIGAIASEHLIALEARIGRSPPYAGGLLPEVGVGLVWQDGARAAAVGLVGTIGLTVKDAFETRARLGVLLGGEMRDLSVFDTSYVRALVEVELAWRFLLFDAIYLVPGAGGFITAGHGRTEEIVLSPLDPTCDPATEPCALRASRRRRPFDDGFLGPMASLGLVGGPIEASWGVQIAVADDAGDSIDTHGAEIVHRILVGATF